MPSRDPSLALVLSGGGARGAFEAGVFDALETGRLVRFSNRPLPNQERDERPNVVAEPTVDHVLRAAGWS